jgi:hypothetical protein
VVDVLNIQNVSVAIRDAVAPVFLLTGIGAFLTAILGRLARAIDRARIVNDFDIEKRQEFKTELRLIIQRIKWLRRAVGFATLGALLVCISITSLFVSVETGLKMPHVVLLSFISAMGAIIITLLCFLREILLTSKEVIVASRLD